MVAEISLQVCEHYFWRSHPLKGKTGTEIFAALFQPQTAQAGPMGIATLLESPYSLPPDSLPARATPMARYSICAGAPRVVAKSPQVWTPAVGQILPFLQLLCEQPTPKSVVVTDAVEGTENTEAGLEDLSRPEHLPFIGGWLGWLGYDLAWEIEKLPWLKEDQLPFPVAFWYEPATFAVLDHQQQQLWLAAERREVLEKVYRHVILLTSSAPTSVSKPILNQIAYTTPSEKHPVSGGFSSIYIDKKIDSKNRLADLSPAAGTKTSALVLESDQTAFEQAVKRAKDHIRVGDVFQVNHSLRFQAKTMLSSWEIYQRLHRINPSPFASYWHTPWGAVVSCSPERLVHLNDGKAESRPIAGTRPRGQSLEEDRSNAEELLCDRKERAEHIMLVDLERNDLGRVCKWGSVEVDELMTIERYSHVMHLVSNVVGELDEMQSPKDLIAALFPGGTITGCPKVRCMEIIETLEPVRRSLFYGSCGYFDRRGRLDLNILIRTLLVASDADADAESEPKSEPKSEPESDAAIVWGQVGAGIVADSDPQKEWFESLQKAKAQLLALGL